MDIATFVTSKEIKASQTVTNARDGESLDASVERTALF